MILVIFLISLVLALYCSQRKFEWKERNEKSIKYFFFDKSSEFLWCLTLVTFFYTILWWLVNRTTDETTLWWLEKLEATLDSIKSIVSYSRFKPWTAALIISVLIAIDLIVSYFVRSSDLASRYRDYHKGSKRVYLVVVLLCSFTFFGNQIGEQRAGLRLRTDAIKTGYVNIQAEAEEELSVSVQQEIYDKVVASFPSEVRESLNYPKALEESLTSLRQTLASASEKYAISDESAAEILRRHTERASQSPGIADKPVSYYEPRAGQTAPPEAAAESSRGNLTVASVNKTVSTLDAKRSARSRFVSLLKRDSSSQLLAQFPKSFTNVAKSAAFSAVIKRYPLLEPVIDVFVGTFDKHVEEKVRSGARKLADSWIEHPEADEAVITNEARTIVDSVEVNLPQLRLDSAARQTSRVNTEIAEITAAQQRVAQAVETKKQTEDGVRDSPEDSTLKPCYCTNQYGLRTYVGMRTPAACSGPC